VNILDGFQPLEILLELLEHPPLAQPLGVIEIAASQVFGSRRRHRLGGRPAVAAFERAKAGLGRLDAQPKPTHLAFDGGPEQSRCLAPTVSIDHADSSHGLVLNRSFYSRSLDRLRHVRSLSSASACSR
jgi:hypothetical protein